MTAWLTAVGTGLVSFLLRAAVPLAAGRRELPGWAISLSALVAPAVIAALLAASLTATATSADLLPRLTVLGVGLAAVVRTRSVPLTICAGVAAHALLTMVT